MEALLWKWGLHSTMSWSPENQGRCVASELAVEVTYRVALLPKEPLLVYDNNPTFISES